MLTLPAVQRILTGAVPGWVSATWRRSRRCRFPPRCSSLTFSALGERTGTPDRLVEGGTAAQLRLPERETAAGAGRGAHPPMRSMAASGWPPDSYAIRLAQPPTRDCRTVRLITSATASAAGRPIAEALTRTARVIHVQPGHGKPPRLDHRVRQGSCVASATPGHRVRPAACRLQEETSPWPGRGRARAFSRTRLRHGDTARPRSRAVGDAQQDRAGSGNRASHARSQFLEKYC
jgi:hypothetical protein